MERPRQTEDGTSLEQHTEHANWQQKVWKGCGVFLYSIRPLLLYLFMPGLAMGIGKIVRRYVRSNEAFIAESGNFYTFLGTLLVAFVLYRRAKKKGTTVREETTLSFEGVQVKFAAHCALFGMSVSMFVSSLLTLVKIPYLSESYSGAAGAIYERTDLLLVLLLVGFLSPILEEVIFRGYMLNRLLARFGERASVMITAMVFALCHANLLWMVYAFFMGVFLAALAMRKDNILYPVCVHIGFNLPSVLIAAIQAAGLGGDLFFRNRLFIVLYGLIGGAAGRLLWLEMKKEDM